MANSQSPIAFLPTPIANLPGSNCRYPTGLFAVMVLADTRSELKRAPTKLGSILFAYLPPLYLGLLEGEPAPYAVACIRRGDGGRAFWASFQQGGAIVGTEAFPRGCRDCPKAMWTQSVYHFVLLHRPNLPSCIKVGEAWLDADLFWRGLCRLDRCRRSQVTRL